jgi:hypothetical protein
MELTEIFNPILERPVNGTYAEYWLSTTFGIGQFLLASTAKNISVPWQTSACAGSSHLGRDFAPVEMVRNMALLYTWCIMDIWRHLSRHF